MTPDEQAWLERVETAILALETTVPMVQRVRQVPMDMIAVAVMRELARAGAAWPFQDDDIVKSILAITDRYAGSPTAA